MINFLATELKNGQKGKIFQNDYLGGVKAQKWGVGGTY